MADINLQSFYNVGPGDFILDFLETLGWNQNDLADVTGFSLKSINQLINNKQGITPETAITLEKAFGSPAEFWLEVDAKYQIRKKQEQNSAKNELTVKKAMLRKYMPVSEMKKKGWFLYDVDTVSGIEEECLRIFGQNTVPELDYTEGYKFCARQTRFDFDYTLWYSKTWFEYAKFHAKKIDLPEYNQNKLEEIANNLFSYTTMKDGVKKIIRELSDCGVGFFTLSHLQKTYLDGAAFICGKNPFVVYTCRYDRIDNFWFVLAHEIAHIIHHYDFLSEPFLDNLEEQAESEKEQEADHYAGIYLHQDKVIQVGKQFGKYLNSTRLNQICEQTEVSVPVALGILQHFKLLDWRQFSRYKEQVKSSIPENLMMG